MSRRVITCGGKVKVIACIEAARPKNRSPPADHHDLFDQVRPLILGLCDTTELRSVLALA
ncbi:MAG: hypothetical protein ACI82A_004137 [Candidatus Azotimanducaceae bacterium]|jgi:hypothetical protein